ncbi:MAG: aminoglycoside phosphotransferase family protein [Oscillospiraceae bacterium]|jgi:streptomycin 6-kinase|nr:aminoglycoside phosphotransferase family protein [Oscillospiraceae bacterium]
MGEIAKIRHLTDIRPIDYHSVNELFTCRSAAHGDAVLKRCNTSDAEFAAELNTLREYGGRRFCRVLEYDSDNKIMLLERVTPGTRLKAEPSLERRLDAFASLFQGLHIEPKNAAPYPSCADRICRAADFLLNRSDCRGLHGYAYALRAKELCLSLSERYPKKVLLHGDLHFDNILKNSAGGYTIIDPHGVIGDPIFDVPRYILNEFWDYRGTFPAVIGGLSRRLNISEDVLRQGFFIEAVLSTSWDIEDGNFKNTDDIAFAASLLEG